jgi:cell division septum initiation protein DivIVA
VSGDHEFDLLAELPAGLGAGPADETLTGVPMASVDPRTADVYGVLDELSEMVELARAVPMSDRCVISRNQALDLLDAVRAMLPTAVQEAEEVLADRVGVIEDAYREAERLIAEARVQSDQVVELGQQEHARLVSAHEVTATAVAQAEALRAQAWAETDALRADVTGEVERMRQETDDYIDSKFAAFEATLAKTLSAVTRGRERLGQRQSGHQYGGHQGAGHQGGNHQ